MQLWFARSSEITLREQLVTQIVLGILSDDLRAGQRLPSTREMARRFRVHPNTISAGYRQLERDGWVESRRGSGVYVRRRKPERAKAPAAAFDRMVAELFQSARALRIPLASVHARLRGWLEIQPPDHFLLIEPDEELARILAAELEQSLALPVRIAIPRRNGASAALRGAVHIALASSAENARRTLPNGSELLALQVRSVPKSLADWLPAPPEAVVAVASRWLGFLKMARTMLVAAGFRPDNLMLRDARKRGWQRGLSEAAAVICDVLTAQNLRRLKRVVPFAIVSDASMEELRRYEKFIRQPLLP